MSPDDLIGESLRNLKLLEIIGTGGQGTVYKALDTKLSRNVAVKVLAPELTVNKKNLRYFEREARLASALDHPNICTVLDLDEINGIHFITMQYVEGRNVRQFVAGRPIELENALLIAIQVADALVMAHSRGIIHRDIKSGNVMVTSSRQVKVLDFGLAKLLDDSDAASTGIHRTDFTELGVPYGTAAYAAPEQSLGQRVDKRVDIFSTGVVLYEMLTGTWPFSGKTRTDIRYAVIHNKPRSLASFRGRSVPPGLQFILDRSLAKQRNDRYQNMEELRDALRSTLEDIQSKPGLSFNFDANLVSRTTYWLKSIARIVTPLPLPPFLATPNKWTADEKTSKPVTDQSDKSVAILPFRNLSVAAAASIYDFSLADGVITELARVRSLVVVPSSVVARFQGKHVDPREVGQELNVSAVLSAGYILSGEHFRVTAQLLDVVSGEILWSDRIDAAAADIIEAQDMITQRIVEGLRLELAVAEKTEIGTVTKNADAYEQYLRGRDLFARFIFRSLSLDDCAAAIRHFENAIQLDPSFALAYNGLGATYVNRVFKGFGGAEDFERAEVAFKKALSLNPNILEARALMVFIYLWRGGKQKARDQISQMRREAPNEPVVHLVKAMLHRMDGEYQRALRSYDRLERLDPAAHVVASYSRALVHMYTGNFDETFKQLDNASEPDNPLVQTFRALAFYYTGQTNAAAALMTDVVNKHPNMYGIRPYLAMILSAQGKHHAALAELTTNVIRLGQVDADVAYGIASVFAIEDEADFAFDWLSRSIKLGNENRPLFENDPNWHRLRGDPRFQKLIGTLGNRLRE